MHQRDRAFTLVELLIVIIVIAVLAAIAIPKFSQSTQRSKEAALRRSLADIRNAIQKFHALHGGYPNDIEDLTDPLPPTYIWTQASENELFGSRPYAGALLQQGQIRRNLFILDPVSGLHFTTSRSTKTGELRVRSSATGTDLNGTAYSSY
jgi:prepilin-type N-terminal cleavage/methylation domain-containing protein